MHASESKLSILRDFQYAARQSWGVTARWLLLLLVDAPPAALIAARETELTGAQLNKRIKWISRTFFHRNFFHYCCMNWFIFFSVFITVSVNFLNSITVAVNWTYFFSHFAVRLQVQLTQTTLALSRSKWWPTWFLQHLMLYFAKLGCLKCWHEMCWP